MPLLPPDAADVAVSESSPAEQGHSTERTGGYPAVATNLSRRRYWQRRRRGSCKWSPESPGRRWLRRGAQGLTGPPEGRRRRKSPRIDGLPLAGSPLSRIGHRLPRGTAGGEYLLP